MILSFLCLSILAQTMPLYLNNIPEHLVVDIEERMNVAAFMRSIGSNRRLLGLSNVLNGRHNHVNYILIFKMLENREMGFIVAKGYNQILVEMAWNDPGFEDFLHQIFLLNFLSIMLDGIDFIQQIPRRDAQEMVDKFYEILGPSTLFCKELCFGNFPVEERILQKIEFKGLVLKIDDLDSFKKIATIPRVRNVINRNLNVFVTHFSLSASQLYQCIKGLHDIKLYGHLARIEYVIGFLLFLLQDTYRSNLQCIIYNDHEGNGLFYDFSQVILDFRMIYRQNPKKNAQSNDLALFVAETGVDYVIVSSYFKKNLNIILFAKTKTELFARIVQVQIGDSETRKAKQLYPIDYSVWFEEFMKADFNHLDGVVKKMFEPDVLYEMNGRRSYWFIGISCFIGCIIVKILVLIFLANYPF